MVQAASLVLDHTVYPRHEIDATTVRDLVRALDAGVNLPAIIADRKTRRVVDGFHRVQAALRHEGAEAEIAVEWRDYATDGELFLDAVRLNAGHGRKLSPFDKAHCIVVAATFQVDETLLATAMSITPEYLGNIRMRKTALGPDDHLMPIKRSAVHLAQGHLAEGQVEGNRRASGQGQVYMVNQVINLIESELLDTGNPLLIERLSVLARLLEQVVGIAA